MGEKSAKLLEEVADAHHSLENDLDALELRLRHDANVRVQIQKHPRLAIGTIVVCALLALMVTASVKRLLGRSKRAAASR
jgi:hypothetical protein